MSQPVRIRGIVAGGDGVGTLEDGRAVFVPRTAPGDLIEPAEVRFAKRFARARIGRVLEASPARVMPACPHYEADGCGGCQLQHLSADAQREARRRLVVDAFRRIGHLEIDEPTLEPSETEWEYRTRVSLAVHGRTIGYHRVGRPGDVFDLVRCAIARPELNALWAALRRRRRLLPTAADQVVLRVDRSGGRHLLVRVKGTEAWIAARELGEALAREGIPVVLWWWPEGGAPRTVYGAREAFPATVFEQVHPVMGDRVRAHAITELGDLAGRHAWDLYAGIGESTRTIRERGATVESVEHDRRAVELAEARGPAEGVTRLAARVEAAIERLHTPDVVLVNPPRTGLGAEVAGHLAVRRPGRVVYVSCDPATLARDAARLADHFRPEHIAAFDLFPQTAHVECVVRFERR